MVFGSWFYVRQMVMSSLFLYPSLGKDCVRKCPLSTPVSSLRLIWEIIRWTKEVCFVFHCHRVVTSLNFGHHVTSIVTVVFRVWTELMTELEGL